MQIIDIGICVSNTDPKGLGRIRYRPYSLYMSEIAKGIDFEKWDDLDPFIAIPFLPLHINIIPQVQQSIKLLRYDTDKESQNVEYIAGPFTSPHDLQNQTFTAQHKDTTYGGVIVKDTKNIRNTDGEFNSPSSRGVMINERDTGFRGNYGSDIIFSENGVQLRGGMLLAKQGKKQKKESLLNYPQMSKKMGRLSLKKFPTTLKAEEVISETSTVAVSRLKYIIEYEIDDLSAPSELKIYAYQVLSSYGVQFNTDVFGESTVFNTADTSIVKLINTGSTITDPTHVVSLDGTISSGYIELREVLHLIDTKGLKALDSTYPSGNSHPFYYRPTTDFVLTKGTTPTETSNKTTFLSKIRVRNKATSSGLIYSKQRANPPIIASEKKVDIIKEVESTGEQSFGNLSADKIYITSTDANGGVNVKKINFDEIDEYEPTQEDYIKRIGPNTYSMVRGENLYNILAAIINLLDSHIHNINEPLVRTDPNWVTLNKLIESMRNDILNDSIRIN